jgi:hypothetical protein
MNNHIYDQSKRSIILHNIDISTEVLPPDQTQFISNLLQSFEHYSDQSNEYFQETINFLHENCFLDPLVCSLRAVMNQGFTSFPDF